MNAMIEELEKKLDAARKAVDVAMRSMKRVARRGDRAAYAATLLAAAIAEERAAFDALKKARAAE